jgi:hypothetical protein
METVDPSSSTRDVPTNYPEGLPIVKARRDGPLKRTKRLCKRPLGCGGADASGCVKNGKLFFLIFEVFFTFERVPVKTIISFPFPHPLAGP